MSNRIKSGEIQMGNNYVLPIEQSNVTRQQAKVKKILEDTDAQVQAILGGAENKSQIIVNTAQNEAERIIITAKEKAQNDYDEIKQQAYNEGFEQGQKDGLEKFQNDTIEALKSLETLASSSFEMKENIINSATLDILELVTVIADKVCHAKFDETILKQITLDAIKELNEKENITIVVNPKLAENISTLSEEFKNTYKSLENIKIREDNSVSPDGVIVETLNTRLDARISSRIATIAEKMLTGTDDGLE
ncbi:MAG: hypothetical protein MJ237_01370 [bacterium]|nr:hypothetical protein [bacterium]